MRVRALALSVLLLAGCPEGGVGPADLSGIRRDMAVAPDMSTTTTGTAKIGTVNASSYNTGSFAGGSVQASFLTIVDPPGFSCTKTSESGCTKTTCTGNPLGATTTQSGEGDVTITILGTPYTLSYNATNKRYEPSPRPSAAMELFPQNTSVTFAVPTVAAPITLNGPGPQTLVNPPPPASGNDLTIPRNADFNVSWTGGGPGDVTASLSGAANATTSLRFDCSAPASALTLTIPQALMQQFAAGPGQFSLFLQNAMKVNVNGFDTTVSASSVFLRGGMVYGNNNVSFP